MYTITTVQADVQIIYAKMSSTGPIKQSELAGSPCVSSVAVDQCNLVAASTLRYLYRPEISQSLVLACGGLSLW